MRQHCWKALGLSVYTIGTVTSCPHSTLISCSSAMSMAVRLETGWRADPGWEGAAGAADADPGVVLGCGGPCRVSCSTGSALSGRWAGAVVGCC